MGRKHSTVDFSGAAHSDRCMCEFCCNEITDDRSIEAGDRPPGPWRRVLSWTLHSTLVVGAVLGKTARWVVGRGWALYVYMVHPILSRAARRLLSLIRRTRPGEVVAQRWARLSPRGRRVVLVGCGVLAALVIAVSHPGLGPREVRLSDFASMGVIQSAKQPLVMRVRAGSAGAISTLSPARQRILVNQVAQEILPVVEADPHRVVVIHLQNMPLSFVALSTRDRRQIESQLGPNAAGRYETAVAVFLEDVIDAVQSKHRRAILSVLGLPVEPEDVGANLMAVQPTNERYQGVIDRLGPFVPARKFVVMGSTLQERKLARMGMREAMRLRDGRPIVFQTNLRWRALVGEDASVRDFQFGALLGDDPYSDH